MVGDEEQPQSTVEKAEEKAASVQAYLLDAAKHAREAGNEERAEKYEALAKKQTQEFFRFVNTDSEARALALGALAGQSMNLREQGDAAGAELIDQMITRVANPLTEPTSPVSPPSPDAPDSAPTK